ncbi:hypothetical protein [Sphingomonas echinoides]|uniref:Uncharacterized protein n=1 Tax=Sphingomonas echinoides TaxID=59803 RepID=A0ABU4PJR0_9SPHN|nr:hypothetical protein [Sphingomonas echinoides]MDX5983679.1 hypothetical protein [Sphingomonas echinoides]
MARITTGNQNRLAQAQQATFARYMKIYGPWVRKQYAKYRGPPMSFERFAYFEMMSANGTNVAGGLQAQRDQFAGQQRAQRTREQGYSSYRQGMYANSARMDRSAERFDQNVVRGNVAQIDPNTGEKRWLPNNAPENRPFQQGGHTYVQHQGGFYQWNGNGWAPMRRGQ